MTECDVNAIISRLSDRDKYHYITELKDCTLVIHIQPLVYFIKP